jgi:hypothetical protein
MSSARRRSWPSPGTPSAGERRQKKITAEAQRHREKKKKKQQHLKVIIGLTDYMDLPAGRQVKKLIYASIHVIK